MNDWADLHTTTAGPGVSFDPAKMLQTIREFKAKYPPLPEVRESTFAVRRPWVFPRHPFFEWEPKDEPFCRKFGIGHEGPPEPCVLKITDPMTGRQVMYVHPEIMARLWKFQARMEHVALARRGGP